MPPRKIDLVAAADNKIALTKAIYEENRETVLYGLLGWLKH
jgi:hypothetical protein